MHKSHYAKYIKEREDKEIIEDDFGFATFVYLQDCIYIEDVYVVPEKRGENHSSIYADIISDIAKKEGYSKLLGSVVPSTPGSTASTYVLLNYGFKLLKAEENMIYFMKEIK
jgi:predicted GNAT superfamily acetyltransferase